MDEQSCYWSLIKSKKYIASVQNSMEDCAKNLIKSANVAKLVKLWHIPRKFHIVTVVLARKQKKLTIKVWSVPSIWLCLDNTIIPCHSGDANIMLYQLCNILLMGLSRVYNSIEFGTIETLFIWEYCFAFEAVENL